VYYSNKRISSKCVYASKIDKEEARVYVRNWGIAANKAPNIPALRRQSGRCFDAIALKVSGETALKFF
jgi:hypothetical protein